MGLSVAFDEYWHQAWEWLKMRRKAAPSDADIWHLRFHHKTLLPELYSRVLTNHYQLSPMCVFNEKAQWCSQDALVLKWVALQVDELLPKHGFCHHVKGHGGSCGSVELVAKTLQAGRYHFALHTDIRGYYAAINKTQLLRHVSKYVTNPVLYNLIEQYVHYSVENAGLFHTPEAGIPRGCALSPLLGGSFLYHIDQYYYGLRDKIFYARYMDDFLIMSGKHWTLRRCIAALNHFFDMHGFEKHPDKTQIGKLEKGFDWLGVYFIAGQPPAISSRSMENHRNQRLQLYERARRRGLTDAQAGEILLKYEHHWRRWAKQLLIRAVPTDKPHYKGYE